MAREAPDRQSNPAHAHPNPRRDVFGYSALGFGAAALMLVLIHFWAGPFAPDPRPSVETAVAETAVRIRDATVRALKGEDPPPPERPTRGWDIDKATEAAAAGFGGLAIILGLVGFVRREARRPAFAGAVLGSGAIAFQMFTFLAFALLGVILIAAVLQKLDFSFDL